MWMGMISRRFNAWFTNKELLWSFFFILVVCTTFFPVFSARYMLNFDDNTHLFYNSLVRDTSWRTPLDIFFTHDTANKTYVPLTILTFFYENIFFGLHPLISHTINLMIHLGVCALAYFLGKALGLSRMSAYIGALLFAIHPLHVEPVAWVTARKDLLYSFFYLSSLLSYINYVRSGKGKDYIFALLAAALAVLSKPMGLSLPLVLFLLDWYLARPFSWKLLADKIPFFLVVQPLALITYTMNAREVQFSWFYSPLLWVWCAAFYIQKFFLPVNLSVVYGASLPVNFSNVQYVYAFIVAFIALGVLWIFRHHKVAIFSAGLYVLSLFFIWRFDFYDLTFVADRFMYLPSLGLCFLFGIIVERCWTIKGVCRVRLLLGLLLLVVMGLSFTRASIWKNTYSLFRDNFKRYPSSFTVNAYGESLLEANCFKDNREDFIRTISRSLNASPVRFKEYYAASLGSKLDAARRMVALKSFYLVLSVDPNDLNALENTGLIYTIFRQYEKALPFFDRAIVLSKGLNGEYFFERGVVFEYLGKPDIALGDYQDAIRLNNAAEAQARLNRANILKNKGEFDQAMAEVLLAIKRFPGYDRGYDLAVIIAQAKGDTDLIEKIHRLKVIYQKWATKR